MAEAATGDYALDDLVVGEARARAGERRWTLIGCAVLACTLGAGLAWSSLAPLASAVVAQGAVKVDSSRKKIQHPEGGVVQEILVRDGSVVQAGDVLVRLDATKAESAWGVVRGGRDVALATVARLESERDGRAAVRFPAELSARGSDPQVAQIVRAQEQLFHARRASRTGELGILDQQIASLRSETAGFQSQQRSKEEQIASLQHELAGLVDLDRHGMVEKTRLRAMERDIARLQGERDELVSKAASTRTAISEKELKKFQVQKAFHEEVVAELKKVQAEHFELLERESATRRTLDLTELRAPVAGTVTDVRVHTAGGVVGPGEILMELVPSDDPLVIEARVQPSDIDRVQHGQPAGIKVHAFNSRTTPELEGTVSYVSADAVADARTEQTFFVVKLAVPPAELARLDGQRLQPGMQVDAYIRTGERTFLGYLMQPLSDSFDKAWRER